MKYTGYYQSPIGTLKITCNETSIIALCPTCSREATAKTAMNTPMELAFRWLDEYFAKKNPEASNLPLDPQGTPFQKAVWMYLRSIPYGTSTTYGHIAKDVTILLGKEKMSPQAVGQAVGANPVGIILPCHRVLGTGGTLAGYAWGLDVKIWLLDHENIPYKYNACC